MRALYGWEELWTHKKIQILFLNDWFTHLSTHLGIHTLTQLAEGFQNEKAISEIIHMIFVL